MSGVAGARVVYFHSAIDPSACWDSFPVKLASGGVYESYRIRQSKFPSGWPAVGEMCAARIDHEMKQPRLR
jgi:hypothetical protein